MTRGAARRWGVALALLIIGAASPALPAGPCHGGCATSPAGLALIKRFEGFRPFPYRDAAGKLTIGWGHLIEPGEPVPLALAGREAEALFLADVREHAAHVDRMVRPPLWPLQFDALVSFAFNLGPGALGGSTLLQRVNAGRHAEAAGEFGRWIYATDPKTKKKRRLPGLEKRRFAEAGLYRRER